MSFSRGSSRPQGSNPGLPHCRQTPYHLSPQGGPERGKDSFKATEQSILKSESEPGLWASRVGTGSMSTQLCTVAVS